MDMRAEENGAVNANIVLFQLYNQSFDIYDDVCGN